MTHKTKRNPWRTTRTVAKAVGIGIWVVVLLGLITVLAFVIQWWTLAVVGAMILYVLVLEFGARGILRLESWWKRKERNWHG